MGLLIKFPQLRELPFLAREDVLMRVAKLGILVLVQILKLFLREG